MYKSFFLLVSLVLLGCTSMRAPKFETKYKFQEPATEKQRECIVNFKIEKDRCEDKCLMRQRICLSSPTQYPYHNTNCYTRCQNCTFRYIENYKLCGLEVEESKVCYKNCKSLDKTNK